MYPGIYNPVAYQGDSWSMAISVTRYEPPSGSVTAFDLTGYDIKSQLRRRADASGTVLEFVCYSSAPESGIVYLEAAPSLTHLVPAGSYSWDLQISGTSGTTSGTVTTLVRGQYTVVGETTR